MLLLAFACADSADDSEKVASNSPPAVTVLAPGDAATLRAGDPLQLAVELDDAESPAADLALTWVSDLAGALAVETTLSGNVASGTLDEGLEVGTHVLTALATDPGGASGSDSVTIEVVANDAPTIAFTAPADGAVFTAGAPIRIELLAGDDADELSTLTLGWSGDLPADDLPTHPDSSGVASFSVSGLAAGAYAATVSVTDAQGASGSANLDFLVIVDADGDGFSVDDDCDDDDATVSPDATERCDGVDDDCDGETDEADAADAGTWYADADEDGFGDAVIVACSQPAGSSVVGGDCDDGAWEVNPDAVESCDGVDDDCDGAIDESDASNAGTWFLDGDGDTFGDATVSVRSCAAPAGYVADDTDCDDTRTTVNPGAIESCDGIDDDCDAAIDEPGATGETDWYLDVDGDGYGTEASIRIECTQPAGYAAEADDCDDDDATVSPGAMERCDGLDEDCDGVVDNDATDAGTWYTDADGDGQGAGSGTVACTQPEGTVASAGDCDDADTAVYTGASELCDGLDNNCDGAVDETPPTWYRDADGDGYGTAATTRTACSAPSGYVAVAGDCDDFSLHTNPGEPERCDDTQDNNCDGLVDDGTAVDATVWYTDADGDDWGDTGTGVASCTAPAGTVALGGDCDDADPSTYPGAVEYCDGVDHDCETDGAGTLEVPTEYTTLTEAVAAASSGDLICLDAGTYELPPEITESLVIQGVSGSGSTYLDASAGGTTLTTYAGDVEIIGVTISGYAGTSDPILSGETELTLEDVVFEDNTCTSCESAVISVSGDLALYEVTIQGTDAVTTTGATSLVYFDGDTAILSDVRVVDNTLDCSGTASAGATLYGGILRVGSAHGLSVDGLTISGNVVDGHPLSSTDGRNGAHIYGGLIYLWVNQSDADVRHLDIRSNTVMGRQIEGGLLYSKGYDKDTARFSNFVFAHNTVTAQESSHVEQIDGGLVYFEPYGSTYSSTLTNGDIYDNDVNWASTVIYDVNGGLIALGDCGTSSAPILTNVNLVGNTVEHGASYNGLAIYSERSCDCAQYSNFYTEDDMDGCADGVGSAGNVSVDPLYADTSRADPLDWDLSLSAGSPVMDAGDGSILDVDGSRSDIGAYGGPDGAW